MSDADVLTVPGVTGAAPDEPVLDLGYTVSVDAFSGPLDLLLFLVRKSELDIIDIPVATITDQFVALVVMWQQQGELDLEVAGDFILMAATLIEIKARTIAPPPVEDEEKAGEDDDDALDPRADLIGKLLAYRRFKEAVGLLTGLEAERQQRVLRQTREEIPEDPEEAAAIDLGELDVTQLSNLWHTLLTRIGGGGPRTVMKDEMPIEASIRKLSARASAEKKLTLRQLFAAEETLQGRISMLMATLECTRQRIVISQQHEQYGDVEMSFREESERAITVVTFPPDEPGRKRRRRPPLVTYQAAVPLPADDLDEAGEVPEEKHETDEERFLRELNEACDLDGVLARVVDVEKGFQAYWDELHPPAAPVVVEAVTVAAQTPVTAGERTPEVAVGESRAHPLTVDPAPGPSGLAQPAETAPASAGAPEPVMLDAAVPANGPTADHALAEAKDACSPASLPPAVLAEPVLVEPVVNELIATEAGGVGPVVLEPVALESVALEPVALEPVGLEPVASEPVASEPVALEPVPSMASQPVSSEVDAFAQPASAGVLSDAAVIVVPAAEAMSIEPVAAVDGSPAETIGLVASTPIPEVRQPEAMTGLASSAEILVPRSFEPGVEAAAAEPVAEAEAVSAEVALAVESASVPESDAVGCAAPPEGASQVLGLAISHEPVIQVAVEISHEIPPMRPEVAEERMPVSTEQAAAIGLDSPVEEFFPPSNTACAERAVEVTSAPAVVGLVALGITAAQPPPCADPSAASPASPAINEVQVPELHESRNPLQPQPELVSQAQLELVSQPQPELVSQAQLELVSQPQPQSELVSEPASSEPQPGLVPEPPPAPEALPSAEAPPAPAPGADAFIRRAPPLPRPWSRTVWVMLAGLAGGTLAGWWVSAQVPPPLPLSSPSRREPLLPVALPGPSSSPVLRVATAPPSVELRRIAEGPASQWCAPAPTGSWPLVVPWSACLPRPPWPMVLTAFAEVPSFTGLPPAALVVDRGWTWYAGGAWAPPSRPRFARTVPELAFVEPLAVPATLRGWQDTPDLRLVPVAVFARDLGWTVFVRPALTAPVSLVVSLAADQPPSFPSAASEQPVDQPPATVAEDQIEDFATMLFGPDWSPTVEPVP